MPRPVRSRITVEAPAKVNLVLRVLDRDAATGFHDLETVFQAVDLTDRVVLETDASPPGPPDAVELDVVGADLGPPERNLVSRAARAFFDRSRSSPGIGAGEPEDTLRIRLEKRIPAGAGLGGGSSDAAATLRALNLLYGEPLGRPAMHEVAASLGSDVPFFLCGSATAVGWGRGDRLRALPPLPSAPTLIVLPGVHVATAEAYRALAEARASGGAPRRRPGRVGLTELRRLDWDRVAREAGNDFEGVVPARHPPVARALEAVRSTAPRLALLSGSGSAVFGVYRDRAAATAAREALETAEVGEVRETRTLERMPTPVWEIGGSGG